MDFSSFKAVLLDLDGTIYHEEHALPGAAELVRRLERESVPCAFLSNSTTTGMRLSQRLGRMGILADPARIYTAAEATADYVLARFGQHPRIFNLATEGIEELLDGKVSWVESEQGPCDAVIAGAPLNVYATEPRQRMALALLRGGAALVGICADRVYPSPRGIEFGSGAFCALLSFAANTPPTFCGKPQPIFFQKLCDKLGVRPADCLLIGDNLESDIAGGKAMGMETMLVMTGVTHRGQLERIDSSQRPDWIIDDLRQI